MFDASASAFMALISGLDPILLGSGQVLVRQGEGSDAAYYLAEGTVAVQAETPYGLVPLSTLAAPRLIGEIGVLADMARTASITALTDCRVFRLERAQLIELGRQAPDVLLTVIKQLGQQIDGINRTLGLYANALTALEQHDFDRRVLDDLANPPPQLAGFAATFRRFASEIQAKSRQRDELASAALIQNALLPKPLAAEGANFTLAARMRPARQVGGDFYDYRLIGDQRVAFSVGDVCGKGIPASLFMAITVTTLRTATRAGASVADALASTAVMMARDNAESMFATTFYGEFDRQTGDIEYVNCGHSGAMLLRASGKTELLGATGIPLGLFETPAPKLARARLAPGEAIVVFTDGVTEAHNADGEEFGDGRLRDAAAAAATADAEALVSAVFAHVDDFAAGTEQFDDITCLVLKRALPH